jgi:hypothetical protein
MLGRLGKALRLPPGERAFLFQAWALFVFFEFALRVVPFRRLLVVARTAPSPRPLGSAPIAPPLWRLVRLVEVAGRYATSNPTCLKQALVLSWLLRRRGVATSLHIGVARRDGRLAAHAWLERDDDVILGGLDRADYERLLASDAAGAR